MYLYFLIVYKKYGAVMCKFFGFYGFAKSDLYEMAFTYFCFPVVKRDLSALYFFVNFKKGLYSTHFDFSFFGANTRGCIIRLGEKSIYVDRQCKLP